MPHSVESEDVSSLNEDVLIVGTDNVESPSNNIEVEAGHTQESNEADNDITMADVGVEGAELSQVKKEPQSDFKLEDMFADIDSDEEFASSTGQKLKVESSPEAPASPM